MLGIGFWLPVAGTLLLATGFYLLNSEYSILNPGLLHGNWKLNKNKGMRSIK